MNYVIIGGDAAGMSAAMQITRNDKEAKIITLEKGSFYSYAQCGLPYVIGGKIASTDKLVARTRETFIEKYGIDARILHEVTKVDAKQKKIIGHNHQDQTMFELEYDKLLIATGAEPIIPQWKGADIDGVHTIKTIPDIQRLQKDIEKHDVKDVVIVGGGYIGLEMAENLAVLGFTISIIEQAPQLATIFDSDMSESIHQIARGANVKLFLEESVTEITGDTRVTNVKTDKRTIPADLVIISVGVRPNTKIISETGIELTEYGAIKVNEKMETSIPDIYAAGDCATQYHRIKQKNDYIPLGTHANKQGRVAGLSMVGIHRTFPGVVGTAIMKFFDYTFGRTGISEKEAKEMELAYGTIEAELPHIAGYYPTPEQLKMKIIYEVGSNTLLGAQIIGKEGVDKRIDVLATTLFAKMTLDEIEDLDLAYAPPYNGVWDPVQQVARRREK
ncbi:FAD-dependent oxidoreductase [Bacillus alkalicellulosilyticus]|uniref:FAD-dependent oxidoreductase n=1 Tax=Alkalihalobacterium alkalicellulosilyticum TaxID=1912214 RepID=UPI000998B782|nr:FAD-dependent oxidoreductase [Bacillus alkalicellulosilyticus]